MLTLAWGLFLLVLLAGAGAVLAALLDCDAALLPLPLLSAAALVLYPFGMLGNLRIGAAAAVLLLGAAVVVGVVRLRPAGVGTAVKTALTRPGFALFLGGAAFIWCLFALHRPMFTQWDEFTAWGLAPKMVVERAAFYVADPVNLKASPLARGLSGPAWPRWTPWLWPVWRQLRLCLARSGRGASLCSGPGLCCRSSSPTIRRAAMRRSMPTPWRTCRWRCCLAGHSACIIL